MPAVHPVGGGHDVKNLAFDAGETAAHGLLGWAFDLAQMALLQRAAAVIRIELLVVGVGAGEGELVGGEAQFRGDDHVPAQAHVGGAFVKLEAVRADVLLHHDQDVNERHVGPVPAGEGEFVAGVVEVKGVGDSHLAQIGEAIGLERGLLGFGEGGKEHGRQNGDDGDHDQQLDQGEGAPAATFGLPRWEREFHAPPRC